METKDKLSEGVIFPDNEDNKASEEDIKEVKRELIQGALDSEEINLDNVDDEDLDNLLAKLIKVEERVPAIIKYGNSKGWDRTKMIECVHNYTGMHMNESEEVLDYYMGE